MSKLATGEAERLKCRRKIIITNTKQQGENNTL